MAKKKEGAGQGLIITLVFFVILSLILGALTYFGYSEQENLTKAKDEATKKLATAQVEVEEQHARLLAARMAIGVEEAKDRSDFEGLLGNRKKDVVDELNIIKGKLGDRFHWDNIAGSDAPAAAPAASMLQLLDNSAKDLTNARKAEEMAKNDAKQARDNAAKAQDLQKAAEDQFNRNIADLNKKFSDLNTRYETEFKKFASGLDQQGKEFSTGMNALKDEKDQVQRDLETAAKKRDEFLKLNKKLIAERSFDGPDLIKNDMKKGSITRVDGDFVIINLGSAVNVRPNTTFAVLPQGVTWRDNKEKEKLIKGRVEVVEVLDAFSSRAKILNQVEPIRNPITGKDELYNPAWSANERIHVAFTGAIDLHGLGHDSNEEFIRMLEGMGVIVDSYLDLKTREIKGPGINLNTKFLIIGPDAKAPDSGSDSVNVKDPRFATYLEITSKMGEMKTAARDAGVQVVEARKFLNFMGVRIPERQEPVDYGYLPPSRGENKADTKPEEKK